ncbi:MAG: hypothetical protein AAF654_04490 [Myxococcota bacterium]
MWIVLASLALSHGDHGHQSPKSYSQLTLGEDIRAVIYVDMAQLVDATNGLAEANVLSRFVLRRGYLRCTPRRVEMQKVGVPPSLQIDANFECLNTDPLELDVRFAGSMGEGHHHIATLVDPDGSSETVELSGPYQWSRGLVSELEMARTFLLLGSTSVWLTPAALSLLILLTVLRASPADFLLSSLGMVGGALIAMAGFDSHATRGMWLGIVPTVIVALLAFYGPELARKTALVCSPVVGVAAGGAVAANGLAFDGLALSAGAASLGFVGAWAAARVVAEALGARLRAQLEVRAVHRGVLATVIVSTVVAELIW